MSIELYTLRPAWKGLPTRILYYIAAIPFNTIHSMKMSKIEYPTENQLALMYQCVKSFPVTEINGYITHTELHRDIHIYHTNHDKDSHQNLYIATEIWNSKNNQWELSYETRSILKNII